MGMNRTLWYDVCYSKVKIMYCPKKITFQFQSHNNIINTLLYLFPSINSLRINKQRPPEITFRIGMFTFPVDVMIYITLSTEIIAIPCPCFSYEYYVMEL